MELRGIVLYTVLANGNLTGFYTNNRIVGATLLWERAQLTSEVNGLETYDCVYQDNNDEEVNCVLRLINNNGLITASWTFQGNERPTFIGEGFQMSENQIAISYGLA